jgi:hypothetical protein
MVRRKVQGGEIVPVVLDLRPGSDREAEVGEDLGELVENLADRMDAALKRRRHRQGHVEPLARQPPLERFRLEHRPASRDRLGHALAQGVDSWPFDLPLLWRHAAERLQELGHRPLLAERRDPLGLERGEVGGGNDAGEKIA